MKKSPSTFLTLSDVIAAKHQADAVAISNERKAMAKIAEIASILAENPHIGVLQTEKGMRYYTNAPYRESSHPSALIH